MGLRWLLRRVNFITSECEFLILTAPKKKEPSQSASSPRRYAPKVYLLLGKRHHQEGRGKKAAFEQNKRPATRSQHRGTHSVSQLLRVTVGRRTLAAQPHTQCRSCCAQTRVVNGSHANCVFELRVVFCCTRVCLSWSAEGHRYPDMERRGRPKVIVTLTWDVVS